MENTVKPEPAEEMDATAPAETDGTQNSEEATSAAEDNSTLSELNGVKDSKGDAQDKNVQSADEKSTKSGSAAAEEGEESTEFQEDNFSREPFDKHPFKDVVLAFDYTAEELCGQESVIPPNSLEDTPIVEITKKEDLELIIQDLKKEKMIGVDTQWSEHGYKAVTCLVLISTQEKDFIIDALELKDQIKLLNEIFMDPKIIKILHAAKNDMRWLQKDCDLFFINLFDTKRAMRALGHTRLSLDAALDPFHVVKDPTMLRVDFRKRPLPPKYKDSARKDSHFLLNMYQKFKNQLIEKDLLKQVLKDCYDECKIVYKKISDTAYVSIREELTKIHNRQITALEKLNQWRHQIAEYVDVSPGSILSKNNMKTLIMKMPSDPLEIGRTCSSEHVKDKQTLQEVVNILAEAKGQKPMIVRDSHVIPPSQKHAINSSMQKPVSLMSSYPKPLFGDAGIKRKFEQTTFVRGSSFGMGPKKPFTSPWNNPSWGRGRGNARPSEFNYRSMSPNAPSGSFNRNWTSNNNNNNRRGFW